MMTKLRLFRIDLTNQQDVYFPGQSIQGEVLVQLTKDMKLRGLHVQLHGEAYVHWSEGDDDSYNDTETYVDTKLDLYGQGSSSGNECVLRAGNHAFPFQFNLPLEIPASFEGAQALKQQCYVRYELKAVINRPWKFDEKFKKLITVGSVLDLNTIPNVMDPQQNTNSKTVCCYCCESLPITATFGVDKTGYVPGESIICQAEINDKSGRGVFSSKISLVMQCTYRKIVEWKTWETKQYRKLAKLVLGAVSPGESVAWNDERLVIPPVPPSYLSGCKIISIDYFVKLTLLIGNSDEDLVVQVPIMIGTIPVQSVVQKFMPQLSSDTVTNQPLGFQAPVNFDLPPPSYKEYVLRQVDTTDDDGGEKHLSGDVSYVPSYAYYDWMSHPGPSGSLYPSPASTSGIRNSSAIIHP